MSNLREKLFPNSVLKEHERGLRRYYPLGDVKHQHRAEAMEILFGKPIQDIPPVTYFVCDPSKYIEEFDGKFWVRTTDTREGVKEEARGELLSRVLEQIVEDVRTDDLEAIHELINLLDDKWLKGYLPEEDDV